MIYEAVWAQLPLALYSATIQEMYSMPFLSIWNKYTHTYVNTWILYDTKIYKHLQCCFARDGNENHPKIYQVFRRDKLVKSIADLSSTE